MRIFVLSIGIILILVMSLEISLRFGFGFGTPLLYLPDEEIGYLPAPNQKIRRLGNRIIINQFSMRGRPINVERSPETLRVLMVGDSIVNGGWWTNQSEILSETLAEILSETLAEIHLARLRQAHEKPENCSQDAFSQDTFSQDTRLQDVEVLNASANSWAPRNELAYLKRFGTFEAQIIVLVINTDDLFGTKPSPLAVGRDRHYPDRSPATAIGEVLNRYVLSHKPDPILQTIPRETGDIVGRNLAAIAEIASIAQNHQSQFLLVMTPLKRELTTQGGPRNYEEKARQQLHEFINQYQIKYVDFLSVFNAQKDPLNLYRDHIHLSPEGNHLVSQEISESLNLRVALESNQANQ